MFRQDLGFEVSYLNLTHPNDLIYHNNEADDEDGAFSANGFAIVLKRNIFTRYSVNIRNPSHVHLAQYVYFDSAW